MTETEQTADEDSAFALWSLDTTRRLVRNNLRPGPNFSWCELVITADDSAAPDSHTEPDDAEHDGPPDPMLEDMLSVVLSHHLYLDLLAENPHLEPELRDLSYSEALRVVYHHENGA